jgi:hypothetical protein
MMKRIAFCLAGGATLACSSAESAANPSTAPTITIANQTRVGSAPSGPFVSVLDSIELRVTPEHGNTLVIGQRLGGYRTTATMQPSFPPGNTSFTANVFSNARMTVFTGSASQLITTDILSLIINVAATRPVLLVAPDTARTNTVTSTTFSIYNAGSGTMSWNLTTTDTAFTRCGGQCTFTPTTGSVAAGQTQTIRVSVPVNFPSRLFAFGIQSAEGSVTARWQYSSSPIVAVAVQPNASLHNLGQAFALTPTVQTVGNPSTAVSWSSSSNSVAIVSSTGTVTGAGRGSAIVTATSTADTAKRATVDVRVYDSTAANASWTMSAPATPDTVRRDDPSRPTITFRAQAPGGGAAPFSNVEFWVRPGSIGPWRRIGSSAAAVDTVDGLGNRVWAWSFTWNPDANDAPFTNPSTVGLSTMAIGIGSGGQVTATGVNPNVFVRVP